MGCKKMCGLNQDRAYCLHFVDKWYGLVLGLTHSIENEVKNQLQGFESFGLDFVDNLVNLLDTKHAED
jgi:hypothetical protein